MECRTLRCHSTPKKSSPWGVCPFSSKYKRDVLYLVCFKNAEFLHLLPPMFAHIYFFAWGSMEVRCLALLLEDSIWSENKIWVRAINHFKLKCEYIDIEWASTIHPLSDFAPNSTTLNFLPNYTSKKGPRLSWKTAIWRLCARKCISVRRMIRLFFLKRSRKDLLHAMDKALLRKLQKRNKVVVLLRCHPIHLLVRNSRNWYLNVTHRSTLWSKALYFGSKTTWTSTCFILRTIVVRRRGSSSKVSAKI